MTNRVNDPLKVASWARALAWLFVVASVVAISGVTWMIWHGHRPEIKWYELAVFGAAAVWIAPLFWIVAITGRAPRRWPGVGEHLWRIRGPDEFRS